MCVLIFPEDEGPMVSFITTKLGAGHCEIACRNENRDLIAVITHPPGGKWIVHPIHFSRKKFKVRWAAIDYVRRLVEEEP